MVTQTYWVHKLDLSGLCDIIAHITIWFAIWHFSILSGCFEILDSKHIGVMTMPFQGHVTSLFHVIILFTIGYFLLVVLWQQASVYIRYSAWKL